MTSSSFTQPGPRREVPTEEYDLCLVESAQSAGGNGPRCRQQCPTCKLQERAAAQGHVAEVSR